MDPENEPWYRTFTQPFVESHISQVAMHAASSQSNLSLDPMIDSSSRSSFQFMHGAFDTTHALHPTFMEFASRHESLWRYITCAKDEGLLWTKQMNAPILRRGNLEWIADPV